MIAKGQSKPGHFGLMHDGLVACADGTSFMILYFDGTELHGGSSNLFGEHLSKERIAEILRLGEVIESVGVVCYWSGIIYGGLATQMGQSSFYGDRSKHDRSVALYGRHNFVSKQEHRMLGILSATMKAMAEAASFGVDADVGLILRGMKLTGAELTDARAAVDRMLDFTGAKAQHIQWYEDRAIEMGTGVTKDQRERAQRQVASAAVRLNAPTADILQAELGRLQKELSDGQRVQCKDAPRITEVERVWVVNVVQKKGAKKKGAEGKGDALLGPERTKTIAVSVKLAESDTSVVWKDGLERFVDSSPLTPDASR